MDKKENKIEQNKQSNVNLMQEEVGKVGLEELSDKGSSEYDDDLDDDGEEELYEHHKFVVDKGQSPLRIDRFLTNRMENASRNQIQNAAEKDCILVNGEAVKSNYRVRPFDEISVMLPYPKRELELIPQDIPLDIVFEDDDIIIVNKAPGMVVHPGHGNYSGTLVNALTYHLKDTPLFQEGDMRAGLVHRLDKDTSGLLVIAKNEDAHSHLAKQFFNRTVHRRYLALVWGVPDPEQGTIIGNIGRSTTDRLRMAVFEDGSDGKYAVTNYRLLRHYNYVSLVECKLETGRTHQIRVHMEWKGHPLFNDSRYGGDKILRGERFSKYRQFVENCFKIMPRQGLHAASLGFIHPRSGEQMMFESDIPEDIAAVLERWETYSSYQKE